MLINIVKYSYFGFEFLIQVLEEYLFMDNGVEANLG